VFHDLDASLAAFVQGELALGNVSISFASPDDQFPPFGVTLPALSFFLHDIREKRDESQPAATGVECSYLISAWPSVNVPDPASDEHYLLGEVLKVLLGHRGIPEGYLRGELAGRQPPVRVIDENQSHDLSTFWQTMARRPKTTLHYAVVVGVGESSAQAGTSDQPVG
jgi:hypothetical protein